LLREKWGGERGGEVLGGPEWCRDERRESGRR